MSTYNGRGCSKERVTKWEHSTVYTGRDPPELLSDEEPAEGEAGMLLPIRVEPKRRGAKIDRACRIDYARLYTIQHTVKVKEFGMVHEKYIKLLRKQWWRVSQARMPAAEEDQEGLTESQEGSASQYLEWVTASAFFEQDQMMTLHVGDRIGVLKYTSEHWWEGINLRSSQIALFPPSYIRRDSL